MRGLSQSELGALPEWSRVEAGDGEWLVVVTRLDSGWYRRREDGVYFGFGFSPVGVVRAVSLPAGARVYCLWVEGEGVSAPGWWASDGLAVNLASAGCEDRDVALKDLGASLAASGVDLAVKPMLAFEGSFLPSELADFRALIV